ncbi:MAG: PA2779 family protein [Burkholderiaceae bacterium]
MNKSTISRVVAGIAVSGLLAATLPPPVAARMVSTEEAVGARPADLQRAELAALLARDDVRVRLEAMGVSPAEAMQRAQALDDQQVAELASQIEQAPAGAGVLAVIGIAFVALVITDLLGYTHIFPFSRRDTR